VFFGFMRHAIRIGLIVVASLLGLACGGSRGSGPAPASGPIATASVAPVAEVDPPAEQLPDGGEQVNDTRIALALVVDRSGSMSGLPMEMTREALKSAARALDPDDWVTIVVFDSQPVTLVEMRRLEARDALDAQIARIQPGGGTEVLSALAHAGKALGSEGLPKRRHVILMSDGQAPSSELEAIVGEVRARGATVSTVALGASADEALLGRIAELGGGRYQRVEDPRALPEVFQHEVERARRGER
jgi:Mg-chelatase subunit ChlD